jgi:Fe-S oxidoreductase
MAYDYKKYFGEITTLHDLTTPREHRGWRLSAPRDSSERHAVVLYLGCNVLRTSHLVQTVTAVFDLLGLDYVAVGGPTFCCGIVHHQHGDTAAAGGMNRHTLDLFERYQPEEVVMWCPSCIYFYDEIHHIQFPFRVRHTTEFLVSQLSRFNFTRPAIRRAQTSARTERSAGGRIASLLRRGGQTKHRSPTSGRSAAQAAGW